MQEKTTQFAVHYGEIHILLGDAGAGKSALLSALARAWQNGEHALTLPCLDVPALTEEPCPAQEEDEAEIPAAQTETEPGTETAETAGLPAQAAADTPPPDKAGGEAPVAQARQTEKREPDCRLEPPPGAAGVERLGMDPVLVERFTVLENMMLGQENTHVGRLSRRRARRRAQRLCERYELDVPLNARVEKLNISARMDAALLRMVYRDGALMLFDDTTARMTPQAARRIERVARLLAQEGRAVVWATGSAEEAMRCEGRVTVLRRNRCVGEAGERGLSEEALRARIRAGDETQARQRRTFSPGRAVLMVRNVTVRTDKRDAPRREAVRNVSFSVREGEILTVLSLPGNGGDELARALAGHLPVRSGQVLMGAEEITHYDVRDRFETGVGFLPGDRSLGLINGMPLRENLILRSYRSPRFAPGGMLKREPVDAFAQDRCRRFGLPGSMALPEEMTQGERVRAILARETAPGVRLLIAQEPAQGLDAAERDRVNAILCSERDHMHAVLLFTTFIEQALALSDRIAVLYAGEIVAEVEARHAAAPELGLYMAGLRRSGRE